MFRKPVIVFLSTTAILLTVLLIHNRHLFRDPIQEDGDYAANSILIGQAKQLRLLVGNYSRLGFNHPGPGILYLLAGSEWLLYDLTGLVPAPHNAHMVGNLALNACLLGLALAILSCHWPSRLATLTALAVFLAYFGLTGVLAFHWMPHVYFTIFLAFLTAAASVAAGRSWHLVFLGLAGGLAVHGHVCFVAFVVPTSLAAVVCLAGQHRFRVRELVRTQRWPLVGFGLAVGIMVLPIAIHTIAHYPGEIGKYVAYSRSQQAGGHPLAKAVDFFLACLAGTLPHPRQCILGVFLLFLASLPGWRDRTPWRMIAGVVLVGTLTSASFAYYILRGVDDLQYTYVGIFFGSVLLLGLTVGAMNLGRWLEGPVLWRRGSMGLLGLLVAHAVWTGQFRNNYGGCRFVTQSVETLRRSPRWSEDSVVLMMQKPGLWPETAGLAVALERQGKQVYVLEPELGLLFTDRLTITPQQLSRLGDVWMLDLMPLDAGQETVLADSPTVALRELPPRSEQCTDLTFGETARRFTVSGWSSHAARDATWTDGPEARLDLPVGVVSHDVELTLTTEAFLVGATRRLDVDVVVNQETVGHWVFEGCGSEVVQRHATIPAAALNRQSPAELVFRIADVKSPLELGLSRDSRRLGLAVRRLTLRP